MSDWRAKPRTGKAEFLKHLGVIQVRLDAGETQNAIRHSLTDESDWSISAAQFSRYVKAYTTPATNVEVAKTRKEPQGSQGTITAIPGLSASHGNPIQPTERKPLTPADFKRIRAQTDDLDLNALIENSGTTR